MRIFGHRGAAGLVAENTLPSFERAIALGCHGIECDVWLVEGHAVIIHDDRADRTTDLSGPIHVLGLAALRACDAGGGAGVPLLEDLAPLLAAHGELVLNVELKEPAVAVAVARWLAELAPALRRRVLLSSFQPAALADPALAGQERALCVERLDPAALAWARRLDCAALHPDQRMVDAAGVALVGGLPLRAWTVNDPQRAGALRELGVAAVFTDRPDLLLG